MSKGIPVCEKYINEMKDAKIRIEHFSLIDKTTSVNLADVEMALRVGLNGFCESNEEAASAAFDALIMLRTFLYESSIKG